MSTYAFNWYAVPLAFTSLTSLAVGAVILKREWASKVGRAFFLVTLVISIWMGAEAFACSATDVETAMAWVRLVYVVVPFLPVAIYLFNVVVLRTYREQRVLVWAMVAVSTAFAVAAQSTDLLLAGIQRAWWGFSPTYGILGPALIGFFGVVIAIGVAQYRVRLQDAPDGSANRRRIRLSLVALAVISIAAVDFLPRLGWAVYPFGHVALLSYLLVITALEIRERVVCMTPAFAAGQILATMQGAILVGNLDGTIEVSNNAAAKLLGYKKGELLDLPVEEIAPTTADGRSILHECLDQGMVRDREMSWRAKDGREIDVSVSASLITEPDHRPVGMVLAALETTERNRAEAELRHYAQRLESIHELDRAILSAESPAEVASVALVHLRGLLPLAWASVVAYDATHDRFSVLAVDDRNEELDDRCRLLRVPIILGNVLVGTLDVGFTKPHTLDEKEIEIARGFTDALAIALQQQTHRETLRQAEARFRTLFEGVPIGLYRSTPGGRLLDVNKALVTMLGYPDRESLLATSTLELYVNLEDRARLQDIIEQNGTVREFEVKMVRHDGTVVWIRLDCSEVRGDEEPEFVYEGSLIDITQRKEAESRLVHDALHDSLTGLPNRAYLTERLVHAIEYSKRRNDYHFALLFLDFDRFKVVNDSLGHAAGDHLLIAVTQRLKESLRNVDMMSRLGGDEFALLVEDAPQISDATLVADRVLACLARPFVIRNQEVFISASIGIAYSVTGYDYPDEVLRDADIAMYRAKAQGRARYEVFDVAMHKRVVETLTVETDLRRAINRDELRVHYQPIVSVETGAVVSLEALVRWQHPARGLLLPKDFLSVAEETGLIVPLGHWVLQQACGQMHRWRHTIPSARGMRLSVNLSEKQFRQPDLVEHVAGTLRATGLDPSALQLELTENVVMDDAASARQIIRRLKALGVVIHIDDFGTGLSSLSVLHHFAVDTLKMDRSFLADTGNGHGNAEVVEAIISVAHTLGMDVVAEGVERQEQLGRLRLLGCEYAQGYLFSRPLPALEAEAFLGTTPSRRAVRSGS